MKHDEWNNPSIQQARNPFGKLFRAVWAWHFVTKLGLVFLILGTVDVLYSENLDRVRFWLIYGAALVYLGVWRKRRTTSQGRLR
ncbi:MAG: hypothetical protein QF628_04345 [Acidimicrobiales bacterium]|jgi:hypothetical protein|nr:hypothetical protein [Actinomycetota bacterium]MDP6280894.1 hypothetical protein [Acidimicrobiales bacterium]MDP7117485.1 hypothetical protein [Acidimicrobiales bacterium]|tara:strand:+ start:847 stop:1098 length:252 start_codon:yes stop_codon:yes gene_type:complete